MDKAAAGQGEAGRLVVLVGLTAGWRKRRAIRRLLQAGPWPVLVPGLPFPLGLRACAWVLRRHLARGPAAGQPVHVLAYIGGAGVLRVLGPGALPPVDRMVLDRSAIQERVPGALAALAPRWVVAMLGGAGMLGLMDPGLSARPLPPAARGFAVIEETRASRLARLLRVDRPSLPMIAVPGAADWLRLPLSHDDVYQDAGFARAVLGFLATGRFDGEGRAMQQDAKPQGKADGRPDPGRRPIPARDMVVTRRLADWLATKGATPNGISAFGLAAGVGSGLCLGLTSAWPGAAPALWLAAAALVGLRGLSNVLDGMLAVERGQGTAAGLYWNEVPDRLSDVALMVGAGLSLGGSSLAGWLCAVGALLVTYVRAVGVMSGARADFGGPLAKQQRMFSIAGVAVLLALVPGLADLQWQGAGLMALWLWLMVPGLILTGWLRMRRSLAQIESPDP